MLDVSLVAGPIRVVLLLMGPVAFVLLLLGRRRGWWTRRVPVALLVGLVAALGMVAVVDVWWRPFPDPVPLVAVVFTGLTVAGIVLAFRGGLLRTGLALVLVVLVGLSGAAQVNQQFEAYPTLRGVLHLPLVNQVPFSAVPGPSPDVVTTSGTTPLRAAWRPPATMPQGGVVTTVTIPGTVSGFRARPAWVYLPPAYRTSPRPLLPVLVLVPGQPGTPRDWFDGGRLSQLMDAFAAAHAGLAPVVVVPDPLGSQLANPLCVDSPAGNAFTYLTTDVPAWIRSTLQVDDGARHWAVGGASAGGTCALQLAVNAPDVYPTFLDLSGQRAPTLGSRSRTVQKRFGGSGAAFRAVNPLDVLARERFPRSAGVVAVGTTDGRYGSDARQVLAATRAAGMDVRFAQAPGGHSWVVWRAVFADELPWLAGRLGLLP